MGWLDRIFTFGGGEDPEAVRQRERSAAVAQQQMFAQQQAEARAAEERMMSMQMEYLNQLRADQIKEQEEVKALDPTATRQAAMGTVGGYFTPEFESTWLPTATTDPLEAAVYGEQRGTADEYLNRLFKRGVITETGKAAGSAELEKQAPRVRTQLDEVGRTLLEAQRGKLGGIAGRARERAGTLNVGEGFDITPFQTQAQGELGTFQSGLSDLFRANVSGDLFDTSKLAALAGGAQGAGNRPFAPEIQPGAPSEEEDPFSGQKPVQKRTATVF